MISAPGSERLDRADLMAVTEVVPARILLVDDRRENLFALRAALDSPDYRFDLATSGDAALEMLLREEPAVILMDVAMPGLDGFETAALIRERERTRHIPIIFITGARPEIDHVFRGYAAGAVDYLVKPVDVFALRAKVAVFVELWRQAQRLVQTSDRLREAERRERALLSALYDLTFEEAPIGIGQVLSTGAWLRVNRRMADLFGMPADRLLATPLLSLTHPDSVDALRGVLHGIVSEPPHTHTGDYKFVRADGQIVWLELRLSLMRDVTGRTIEIAIAEDISALKQYSQDLLEKLAASELRFMRMRKAEVIGVVDVDRTGNVMDSNDTFLELVGYTRDDLHAGLLTWETLTTPAHRSADAHALEELARDGLLTAHETALRRRDGRDRDVLVAAMQEKGGSTTAIVVDISGLKEMERKQAAIARSLEDAVKARDDFLFIAAHELRNPVTPLLMQVTNLSSIAERRREPIDPAWLAQQLAPAVRATKRLASLIDTLLDVSRMSVGRLSLQRSSIDLVEVVKEVLERLRAQREKVGSSIALSGDQSVVGTWDRGRVEAAVENLVSNALKFGEGKPIEVVVSARSDGRAECSVREHGIGISPADQAKIFERFERVSSAEAYPGFGLGLWIVKQIAEAHGGTVTVASTPREGACFTLVLPRTPKKDEGAS